MTPSKAWVVGAGGLLGAEIRRALSRALPDVLPWSPAEPFPWKDSDAIGSRLREAAAEYARAVAASGGPWMVFWCAGAGVVGTTAEEMERETRALESLLDGLGTALGDARGAFFLASSAGGAYADCADAILTEDTPPRPSSDYGRAKLRQEEALARWAEAHPRASTFVGRLSNLYGSGQNFAKAQGLISYLSLCLLHQVPAHVYAPLDTLRDFLFAPDAANRILAAVDRLRSLPSPARVMKIVASGQTTSIGSILSIFRRIARRQPRIICSGSPLGKLQPSRLALRSVTWPDLNVAPPTPLPAGIHAVYRHHLALLQAGRLPALATR